MNKEDEHLPPAGDVHRPFAPTGEGFRWACIEHKPYKEDGRALFKDISRQTLFSRPDIAGELRYFEIAPHGFSTLERHEHVHAVLILRGAGQALVGDRIIDFTTNDLITVPPMAWHQFRTNGEAMGFLCMVDAIRDRPQLPTEADIAALRADPAIDRFLG